MGFGMGLFFGEFVTWLVKDVYLLNSMDVDYIGNIEVAVYAWDSKFTW